MINDKAVYEFLDAHLLHCGVNERYMDLASELGELGKELLKATDYGTKPFERTPDTGSELGDCLFPLPHSAASWGSTLLMRSPVR